jgi:hypothetical protein
MKILDASYLNSVLEIRNAYKPLPNSEEFGLLWSDAQILNSLEKQEVHGILDECGHLMAFLIAQNLDIGIYEIHLMMTHPEAVRRGFMEQLFQSWLQTCKFDFMKSKGLRSTHFECSIIRMVLGLFYIVSNAINLIWQLECTPVAIYSI